jgi:hypothetical protein
MASFPVALPTDNDLLYAPERYSSTLSAGISAVATAIPVAVTPTIPGASSFLVQIDSEIIKCSGVAGGNLVVATNGRGFAGTAAAIHAGGAACKGTVTWYHHNRLVDELEALANDAGVGFTQISRRSTFYDFAAQAPAASLTAGADATIPLSPVPHGVNWNDADHELWIVDAVAGNERVKIKAAGPGTATSGAASGTLTLTEIGLNHAAGDWTIQSASCGLQEAIVATAAAGGAGAIRVPAGSYTYHATVTIPTSGNIHIQGDGYWSTIVTRTEDYGDTVVIGASTVSSVTNVRISGIRFTYDLGYTYDGGGYPTAIARKPTTYPNSAHIRAYGPINCHFDRMRAENMPYNVVINGGAYSSIELSDFQGLWDNTDAALQVTHASVQLNNTATQGHPQGMQLLNNQFFGNLSPARNVTYNATVVSQNQDIGPKYMIEVNSSEVLHIKGGLMGGANEYSLFLHPTGTVGISGTVVSGVHFDGDRLRNFAIDNEGSLTGYAADTVVTGCDFVGSNKALSGIWVKNNGAGLLSSNGLVIVGNKFNFYAGTPILIQDGRGAIISGNSIRNYNKHGAWATGTDASAIAITGQAEKTIIGPNSYGGGNGFEAYGANNKSEFGVYIEDIAKQYSVAPGLDAGLNSANGTDRGLAHSPSLLVRGHDEDQNVKLAGEVAVTGAASISALDKAESANVPLEVRATRTVFNAGPVNAVGVNYIATETGVNNAIAGTLADVPLTAGMVITIKLAHSLQIGDNTFAYNGGAALPIKSSRNPGNNIAVGYASDGTITLAQDTTRWLDVSQ